MSQDVDGTFELPDGPVACRASVPCRLADAAAAAGLVLNVACGGQGTCGGCAVDLLAGEFADAADQAIALEPDRPRRVLACQTKLLGGPFRVHVGRRSLVEAGQKIVMDFAHAPTVARRPPVRKEHLRLAKPALADQRGDLERIADALRDRGCRGRIVAGLRAARSAHLAEEEDYRLTATVAGDGDAWHVLRLEGGDTTERLYAAAADIGTTTVVVALVDLNTGEIADAASSYNHQVFRADNVAGRISYAADPARRAELRELVVDRTVNRLLRLLARRRGLDADDIAHVTISGHTVMTHLFCGLSPAGIGAVPFAPVTNFPGPYRAGELGLAVHPDAFVDVFPSSAAYVGGDITADMFVCGLQHRARPTVLIDIGTNAEIVVGNRERTIACAAPAGPAFEGHGVRCGMRAEAGAVDSVRIPALDAAPEVSVIEGARPAGVCGSGLIDFVAQAFRAGLLTAAGRFSDQAVRRCPRIRRVPRGDSEMLAYELVGAAETDDRREPVVVTEADVAGLLQAKGVIFAALQIALKHFGKRFDEIDRFFLAGGFARHIDLDNAVTMGLLPDIDRDRYVFIGNGSLGGAVLALVNAGVRAQLPHIAAAPAVIELNLDPEFMDNYALAMLLPNGDPSLFPSVEAP